MGPLLTQASVPSQCDSRAAQTQSPPWTQLPSKGTSLLSKPSSRSAEASFCWQLATRPAATAGALARSWAGLYPGTLPRARLNHCPQPGKKSTEREIWGLVPAPPQVSCAASGSSLSGRSAFLPVRTGRCRLLTSRLVPSTGTLNLALPQHQELQKSPRCPTLPAPAATRVGSAAPLPIERAASEG